MEWKGTYRELEEFFDMEIPCPHCEEWCILRHRISDSMEVIAENGKVYVRRCEQK